MRYPKKLKKGDTWGITACSRGVEGMFSRKIDYSMAAVERYGYKIKEGECLRKVVKMVSAPPKERAEEFMEMYLDPEVKIIAPPWGGQLLMDMIPYIDFNKIEKAEPKWFSGFSDVSTLMFVLTVNHRIATLHGVNFMELGGLPMDPSLEKFMDTLTKLEGTVHYSSFKKYQTEWIDDEEPFKSYNLDGKVEWKSLRGDKKEHFKGRIIGGCLDTICKLIGTPYAKMDEFIEDYKEDGFIWYFESCDMDLGDVYRTLWQMKMCGWFRECRGILYGRSEGLEMIEDLTFEDVMKFVFEDMDLPVIYEVDIGHLPPNIPIINGSLAEVHYCDGRGDISQEMI